MIVSNTNSTKKIKACFSLLFAFCICISSLTFSAYALYRGDSTERNIFDSNDFRYNTDAYDITSDLTADFSEDDISEYYTLYAKAGSYVNNDLVFAISFNNLEVNPLEKHVLKIAYKTNLQKYTPSLDINSSGNDECWVPYSEFVIINNSEWNVMYVDLESVLSQGGSLANNYPEVNNPNVSLRFKFFGSHERTLTYDQYMSIRYIGFFETKAEAQAHTFTKISDSEYRELFGLNNVNIETAKEQEIREYLNDVETLKNEIINSPTTVTVTGTKYYVSNNGSDSNDGKSPATAWKTLDKVNNFKFSAGDGVFFERGGLWREGLVTKQGVTYSAYGSGAKPTFYGSVVGTGSGKWSETEYDNIWVFNSTFDSKSYPVNIVFNNDTAWGIRVTENPDKPGYRLDRGKCFNGIDYSDNSGLPFTGEEDLSGNLQFWYNSDNSKLYMYCEWGNPGTYFDTMEVVLSGNGIQSHGSGAINVTIDNICLKYFGNHGVSGYNTKNFTVQYCEIGFIGGNGLGNGIESWTNADNFYVHHNYAYQCYDCAFTAQGNAAPEAGKPYSQSSVYIKNVEMHDNVSEYCNTGLEFWNGVSKENYDLGIRAGMSDINLYDNYTLYAGYGWSTQRPTKDYNFFYGGTGANHCDYSNILIHNNVNMFTTHLGIYGRYITPDTDYAKRGGYTLYNNVYVTTDSAGLYRTTGLLSDFDCSALSYTRANEYNISKIQHYGIDVGSKYRIIDKNYLPFAFNSPYDVKLGDINGNGIIEPDDLIILHRYIAVFEREDTIFLEKNADLDSDGNITPIDVIVAARLIADVD